MNVRMSVGWCRLVCVRSCVLEKRAPLPPEPSGGFAHLETKSDDLSTQNRGGPKRARRYRQSPLEYAPATVSRPSRPKVTTFPRKTAGVQKCAPLPPEPSRVRPCHGFAALETKNDDLCTQNRGAPKRAQLPPEPCRVRPCHGFAALETKGDDFSTQNRGGPKARAATARAL